MCAMIAMAVWDTEENKRTEYTKKTLESLLKTVDFDKHRLIIIDNNSCKETIEAIRSFQEGMGSKIGLIRNKENIGTAEAINKAWQLRDKNENAIKIDNDVIINERGWVDRMEEAIARESKIGQVGLKRKDCWESPDHKDIFYKSKLMMLPHKPGEKWIVVEKVNHVMGTCVMHSAALLNKVGYLYQPRLYGFDDSLMSFRSSMAGFINVFLPSVDIDHIDRGDTDYQKQKEKVAADQWNEYHETLNGYKNGSRSLYYNPFNEHSSPDINLS